MSYLALLFCQDEKTARTITQVLNELEFQVEPSSEAFAAVKKLTTQAFDAVVVDCLNEENASLLLKAARNSASKQASLMVALVEGQTGVAAAFRIGANLVLTKPIAVEQARSTLRVARGLLRKNAGPALAAAVAAPRVPVLPPSQPLSAPVKPVASPASSPVVASSPGATSAAFSAPKPSVGPASSRLPIAPAATVTRATIPSAATRIPVPPSALRAVAASAGLETEAEQQPSPDAASAGLLEALDFKTFEAAPERSFGLSATESVSVVEVTTGATEAVRTALRPKQALSSQEFGGYGAAAAPARELPKAPKVDRSAEVADLFEAPVFGQATAIPTTPAPSGPVEMAPYSADLDLTGGQATSRSKAPVLAIVALLAFAGASYFGWSQLHKPAAATTATAGPLQPPPPDFGAAEPAPAPAPSKTATTPTTDPSQAPVEITNRFARPARTSAAEEVAPDQVTTPVAVVPSRTSPARTSNAAPIEVKTETRRPQTAAPMQEAVEAPSIATLGGAREPDALNAIAHSTTAMPAAPGSQRISQGVSDGLLIKRVQPIYPQQALQMHAQGKVALQATIAKDGSVRNVKVVSGSAVLARSASEAVRQWKYRPYTLNGEPIEVQTDININFVPPR